MATLTAYGLQLMANILQLNAELFKVVGILTLILYILETLKEGYVSFFVNPVWFLALFALSGLVWLFTPDSAEASTFAKATADRSSRQARQG